jgi:uncharacterized protein (TIGR02147 family)
MKQKFANIYNYANYREFLEEYQKNRYAVDKSFSRTKVCQRLGLPNTKSFFRDVLAGKSISKNFVERFIQAFELDKKEARYFRVLVQFTQSQAEEERERLFDQLISLNQTPKRFIQSDSYAFYSARHHSLVRAALDVYTITDNYKYLGSRLIPPISAKEARSSLALLARLKMAKRNKKGQWLQTEKSASAGFCGKNELVKQFQLGKLEQGKKAMLSALNYPNQTLTMTLSLSGAMLEKLEKKVENFRAEVRSMVHKDENPAEQVYQVNVQYFPQSKPKKDDE